MAFVGDMGLNDNTEAVLQLVVGEGADLLVVLGDFDYEEAPDRWEALLDRVLGPDLPVLAVVGNHDLGDWPAYQAGFKRRLGTSPEVSCTGDFGVNAACKFRGLFIVLSGVGTLGTGHEDFLTNALEEDDSIWRVCAWHKDQRAMQAGGKSDEVGWGAYEILSSARRHCCHGSRALVLADQDAD